MDKLHEVKYSKFQGLETTIHSEGRTSPEAGGAEKRGVRRRVTIVCLGFTLLDSESPGIRTPVFVA